MMRQWREHGHESIGIALCTKVRIVRCNISGYALELVALVGLAKSLEILRDPT